MCFYQLILLLNLYTHKLCVDSETGISVENGVTKLSPKFGIISYVKSEKFVLWR